MISSDLNFLLNQWWSCLRGEGGQRAFSNNHDSTATASWPPHLPTGIEHCGRYSEPVLAFHFILYLFSLITSASTSLIPAPSLTSPHGRNFTPLHSPPWIVTHLHSSSLTPSLSFSPSLFLSDSLSSPLFSRATYGVHSQRVLFCSK